MVNSKYCRVLQSFKLDVLSDGGVYGKVIILPKGENTLRWRSTQSSGPFIIPYSPIVCYIVNGELQHRGKEGVELYVGSGGLNDPKWYVDKVVVDDGAGSVEYFSGYDLFTRPGATIRMPTYT